MLNALQGGDLSSDGCWWRFFVKGCWHELNGAKFSMLQHSRADDFSEVKDFKLYVWLFTLFALLHFPQWKRIFSVQETWLGSVFSLLGLVSHSSLLCFQACSCPWAFPLADSSIWNTLLHAFVMNPSRNSTLSSNVPSSVTSTPTTLFSPLPGTMNLRHSSCSENFYWVKELIMKR